MLPREQQAAKHWERVRECFENSVSLSSAERIQYLDRACVGGASLRAEVEDLLQQHDRDTRTLDSRHQLEFFSPKDLQPGSLVGGRFEIVKKLGVGGMGEVYEAHDRALGGSVALKCLRPELLFNPKIRERFKHEILNGRRVTHPNICRIYDLVYDDASKNAPIAFTMELLSGDTLAQLLEREGRLSADRLLPLARQMAAGLSALHACNIVHRDFKPANVMFVDAGAEACNLKITDFGLARRDASNEGDAAPQISGVREIVGTPIYMAPEQLTGDRSRIGPATDVYAFGLVLYEAITGSRPFPAETMADNVVQKTQQQPEPPSNFRPGLSALWDRTLCACLAVDPQDRPQSPQAALEWLQGPDSDVTIVEQTPTLISETVTGALPAIPRNAAPKRERSGKARGDPTRLQAKRLSLIATALFPLIIASFLFQRASMAPGEVQPPPSASVAPPPASLLVLPVANEGLGPEGQYLCDGLTEQLITALTAARNIRVIGRDTAFQSSTNDLPALADTLKVRYIVKSGLSRRSNALQLSVQLIDMAAEEPLWTERYDAPALGAAGLSEAVSSQLATSLKLSLAALQTVGRSDGGVPSPESYDLYLRGLYFWNLRGVANLQRALRYFQQAIEADPAFALPYTGLANCYAVIGTRIGLTPSEAMLKAEEAARAALAINPNLAKAHLSLGLIFQRYHWRWRQAESHFQWAIALEPGNAQAHHWYAGYLSDMGRDSEALQEIALAIDLEPLSIPIHSAAAIYHHLADMHDEAIQQGSRTIELNPNFFIVYLTIGNAYLEKRDYENAIAHFKHCAEVSNQDQICLASLAHGYARAGRREEAQRILTELERFEHTQPSLSFDLAVVYAALGQHQDALDRLEKSYEVRSPSMTMLKVHPGLNPLRSEPRFQSLMTLMKFPARS